MYDVSVTFNDLDNSEALEQLIRDKSAKLGQFFNQIKACDVVISLPHRHHHNKIYHVQIHLSLPGKDLYVNREPEKNDAHADPKLAVRDAFNAITKQLRHYASKMNQH